MLGFRKLCLRLCCFELQTWSPMIPNICLLKYISLAYFHMAMRTHCRVLQTANSAGLLFCQEASIYTGKLLNDTMRRHQWWILVDSFPPDMLPSAQEKTLSWREDRRLIPVQMGMTTGGCSPGNKTDFTSCSAPLLCLYSLPNPSL